MAFKMGSKLVFFIEHQKEINLPSDLKASILILFLGHYLKWKILHFISLEFLLHESKGEENKNKRYVSLAGGDLKAEEKRGSICFIAILWLQKYFSSM